MKGLSMPLFLLLASSLTGLCLVVRFWRDRKAVLTTCLSIVTIFLVLADTAFLPFVYEEKDARPFCRDVSRIVHGEPLFYYGFWDEECTFYLGRQIFGIHSKEDLVHKLDSRDRIWFILKKDTFQRLASQGLSFPFVSKEESPMLRPLVLACNRPL